MASTELRVWRVSQALPCRSYEHSLVRRQRTAEKICAHLSALTSSPAGLLLWLLASCMQLQQPSKPRTVLHPPTHSYTNATDHILSNLTLGKAAFVRMASKDQHRI